MMSNEERFGQSQKSEFEHLEKVKQLIVEHPIIAIGGAFAIGAALGLIKPRSKGSALGAAITGIAMALVRDALVRRMSTYANHWIDVKSREEAMSRQRETEPFIEH